MESFYQLPQFCYDCINNKKSRFRRTRKIFIFIQSFVLLFATYGLRHEVVKIFSSGISLTDKSKIFFDRVAFGQLISWVLVVFFTFLYLSPLRTQLPESFQSLSVIIFSLPLACFISFYSAHLQGLQRILCHYFSFQFYFIFYSFLEAFYQFSKSIGVFSAVLSIVFYSFSFFNSELKNKCPSHQRSLN